MLCLGCRGKFGQVFKLVEKSTKKVWAGKFIKAYSAKEKDNVRQEIGIMNSLHHPKLVQCIDAFEGKSDIVMVLEMYVIPHRLPTWSGVRHLGSGSRV